MTAFMFSSGFTGLFLLCLELYLIQVSMTQQTCEKIDDCSCRMSNGSVISLWKIDGGSEGPREPFKDQAGAASAPFKYSWNPCTPFSEGDGCNDVLLCQTYEAPGGSKQFFPIGKSAKSFTVKDSTVTIEYDPVVYGTQSVTRTGKITLKCDQSSKDPGQLSAFEATKDNIYTSTLTSKCACYDLCPLPPTPTPKGSKSAGGLSAGSTMLIVFFPLVLVYLIGGILFNKYHKGIESIPEVCPNYSFWKDFPFLVKDGFVFTFVGIAGCCRSLNRKLKGDSYAEI